MAEMNPLEVIAECLKRAKATGDRETIGHIVAETLAALQIDNTEDDAFSMLGEAIVESASEDPTGNALLLEVWSELEDRPKSP
ncbi:MAG: hypothetical protein ACREFB_12045 [Stellaceae bacterium]